MQNYIEIEKENDYKILKEPAKIIKSGGIVIFPTETVYGIGANAYDEKAVKRIFDIKKRSYLKPISLLVNSRKMVEEVAKNITEIEYKLMEAFFPGPLTIILKKKKNVPDIVTAQSDTVGIRMPNNKTAQKLIENSGVPLATTSANISGEKSGIEIKEIIQKFDSKVDYFIDDNNSRIGAPSTIVKVIDNVPKILREGVITEVMIRNVLK